eukprot:jgi/Botrbrau1/4083/Bobra.152_3s0034.1
MSSCLAASDTRTPSSGTRGRPPLGQGGAFKVPHKGQPADTSYWTETNQRSASSLQITLSLPQRKPPGTTLDQESPGSGRNHPLGQRICASSTALSADTRLEGLRAIANDESSSDSGIDLQAFADMVNSRLGSLENPNAEPLVPPVPVVLPVPLRDAAVLPAAWETTAGRRATDKVPSEGEDGVCTPSGAARRGGMRTSPKLAGLKHVPLAYNSLKVLVVGARGLGKTTLITSLADLFRAAGQPAGEGGARAPPPTPDLLFRSDPAALLTRVSTFDPEGHHFTFLLQDTPGFHPEASLGVANAVVAHVVRQSQMYLDAEADPARSVPLWEIPDTRVDACLFLVPQEGPGPATLAFLRTLGQLVPVIPILAKAGSLEPQEVQVTRADLAHSLSSSGCTVYRFRPGAIAASGFPHSDHIFAACGRGGLSSNGLGPEGDEITALGSLLFSLSFMDLKKDTEARYLAFRQARMIPQNVQLAVPRQPVQHPFERGFSQAAAGSGGTEAQASPFQREAVPPSSAAAPVHDEVALRNADFVRAISRQLHVEHLVPPGPAGSRQSADHLAPHASATPAVPESLPETGTPTEETNRRLKARLPASASTADPQGPATPTGTQSIASVRKLTAGLAFESILAHANRLTASDRSCTLETDPTLLRVRQIGGDCYVDAVSAHVRRMVAAQRAQQDGLRLSRTISEPTPESRPTASPPSTSSESHVHVLEEHPLEGAEDSDGDESQVEQSAALEPAPDGTGATSLPAPAELSTDSRCSGPFAPPSSEGARKRKPPTPTKQTLLRRLRGFAGKCVNPAADHPQLGVQMGGSPNDTPGALASPPSSARWRVASEYYTPRSWDGSEGTPGGRQKELLLWSPQGDQPGDRSPGEPLLPADMPAASQDAGKPVPQDSVLGIRALVRVKSVEAIKAAVDRWQGNEDAASGPLEAPGTPGQDLPQQPHSARTAEELGSKPKGAGQTGSAGLRAHPLSAWSMDLDEEFVDSAAPEPETNGGPPTVTAGAPPVSAAPPVADASAKEGPWAAGPGASAPVVVSNAIVSIRELERRLAVERLQAAAARRRPPGRGGVPPRPGRAHDPALPAAPAPSLFGDALRGANGLTVRVRSKRPGMWIADAEAREPGGAQRPREGGSGPWSARGTEGSGSWSPDPAEEQEQDRRRSTGSTPRRAGSLSNQVRARVAEFESIVEKSRSLQGGTARPMAR